MIGEQKDIQELMQLNANSGQEPEEKDYVGEIAKTLGNTSMRATNYSTCWAVTEVISTEVFQVNSKTKKVEEGGVAWSVQDSSKCSKYRVIMIWALDFNKIF